MPDLTRDAAGEEGPFRRVAFLGGVYSNWIALREALRIARDRGAEAVYALGDFGAFGPHPDRSIEILREAGVPAIRGNYEDALASGAEDCLCGYTDPRDNEYAALSYAYTRERTSREHVEWMAELPTHRRVRVGQARALLCHGSPRRVNEFLWRSTTSDPFLRRLLREADADLIVCTHTGLPWSRFLEPGRGIVNAGAVGRPPNDGRPEVRLALVDAANGSGPLTVEFGPVPYRHERLAREMESESLPPEFVETIRTGWWTTCLEVLPAKERAEGRY